MVRLIDIACGHASKDRKAALETPECVLNKDPQGGEATVESTAEASLVRVICQIVIIEWADGVLGERITWAELSVRLIARTHICRRTLVHQNVLMAAKVQLSVAPKMRGLENTTVLHRAGPTEVVGREPAAMVNRSLDNNLDGVNA